MTRTKNFKAMAMALFSALAATPAGAANWIYVAAHANNSIYYYDADSVERSGSQVTVWTKLDHSQNKTTKFREEKYRSRIDCVQRTITLLNGYSYYPNGKTEMFTVETWEQMADPVAPDTIADVILNAVCAAAAP